MRNIPIRNYFISFIICVATVLLVFYLMNRYNNLEYKIDYINEISETELEYYVAENNSVYIYLTPNKNSKEFDKQFKNYINNKDINIIYIDLNKTSENFKNTFLKKYNTIIKNKTLVLIENGKALDSINDIKEFEQVEKFIERSYIK